MSALGVLLVFGAVLLGVEAVKLLRGTVHGAAPAAAAPAPAGGNGAAPAPAAPATAGTSSPSSPLTLSQVIALAQQAGFSGESLVRIVSYAFHESTFNPAAMNINNNPAITPPDYLGTLDRGILQFNSKAFPGISASCALDPSCAFRAAWSVTQGGADFSPWAPDFLLQDVLNIQVQIRKALGL